jgi:hypothetical protein
LQIEKLVTDSASLKKNRDVILEDLIEKIDSLLEEGKLSEAIEEFKQLFLLIA